MHYMAQRRHDIRDLQSQLAELQEEILWICEAAHTPVIWATQVLESLAKNGIPSRSEITDAAMGERAECVMLN
jgi:pyruvate kinase